MTNYYIDPDAAGGGSGTYASPWNSIAQANAHSFSTSDGLYFKAGATNSVSVAYYERLDITWDGTEENPAIIGAYYGDGLFGTNGLSRPVISGLVGGVRTGGRFSSGTIRFRMSGATGYVTVQDIHVTGVVGYGIEMHGAYAIGGDGSSIEHCSVINCKVSNTGGLGIGFYHSFSGLVSGCEVDSANQDLINYSSGDGIDIGGLRNESRSQHNVVTGCTVHQCYEGIGNYNGPRYTVISENTVYDCHTVHIYVDNSRDVTIRDNIIYSTPGYRGSTRGTGIAMENESHTQATLNPISGHTIHDNKIAGMRSGIAIKNEGSATGNYPTNISIYDNRLVDSERNFAFYNTNANWSGNTITDNHSFIYTTGQVHSTAMNVTGVTWSGNHYNTGIVSVTGGAATDAVYDSPELVKDSGWLSLTAGDVDSDDFLFVGETAPTDPDSALDATNTFGGATYTPTRLYIFDETAGTTAADLSASAQDATLTNPAWVTNGIQMASTGSIIEVPVPTLTTFSIVLAITSTTTTTQDYVKFFHYRNTNTRDLQLERYTSDTEIRSDINSVTAAFTPVTDVFDQNFHVIVLTSNGSNSRKLYIDGNLMGEDTQSFTYPTFTGSLCLGSKLDGSRQLNATFHMAGIWPDEFSAADALSLYQDYDQMITDPPSRTFSSESEPQPIGTILSTMARNIVDGSKPYTVVSGA